MFDRHPHAPAKDHAAPFSDAGTAPAGPLQGDGGGGVAEHGGAGAGATAAGAAPMVAHWSEAGGAAAQRPPGEAPLAQPGPAPASGQAGGSGGAWDFDSPWSGFGGGARVQAKKEASAAAALGPPQAQDPHAVVSQLGAGSALDGATAARMADGFGESFGDVRVHTDERAGKLAQGLGAQAFTAGPHVAFAPGEYQPGSPAGDALLAHELAHVTQQRGGGPAVHGKTADGAGAHEEDADQAAAGVMGRLYGGQLGLGGNVGRGGAALRSGFALRRCDGKKDGKKTASAKEVKEIQKLIDDAKKLEADAKQLEADAVTLDAAAATAKAAGDSATETTKKQEAADKRKQADTKKKEAAAKKQEAMDKSVVAYGIDVSNVKSLKYDPTVSGEASTSKSRNIRVGDDAFRNPAWLASSIGHEAEVHVNEQAMKGNWYTGPIGTDLQEVETYTYEIENAKRYGTSAADLKDLEARRKKHYDALPAEYKKRADAKDYTMKKGDEAK